MKALTFICPTFSSQTQTPWGCCCYRQHLASFEVPDGRAANSDMNLEDIVKKKDSKLLLSAIADSPISVLKGVTTKIEKTLIEFLHVKTVRWARQ